MNDELSANTECDYLNDWIENGHIRKNLTQNGEPKRYSWGTQKKKEEKKKKKNDKLKGFNFRAKYPG